MSDVAEEEAFVWLTRDDRRETSVAAFQPAGLGIEIESALQFLGLGAMALVAMFDEHRSDLLFEEGYASRVVGGDDACGSEQSEGVRKSEDWFHGLRLAFSDARGRRSRSS